VQFNLLEVLDSLGKRPAMYVGRVSFDAVRAYLSGLSSGLKWAGIEYTWEEYLAAAESRGWNPRGSIGIERAFVEHELSDEKMVQELVAVEMDAYRRALARLGKDGHAPGG